MHNTIYTYLFTLFLSQTLIFPLNSASAQTAQWSGSAYNSTALPVNPVPPNIEEGQVIYNIVPCIGGTDNWGNGGNICMPGQTSGFPPNFGGGAGGGPNMSAKMKEKIYDCNRSFKYHQWPTQRFRYSEGYCTMLVESFGD